MKPAMLQKILQEPFQTLILVGDTEATFEYVRSFYKEAGLDINTHSDCLIHKVDSLSIDTAREIKAWSEAMPQYKESKLLIIAPTLFPHISQNALLKTIEEPSGKTKIIILVKSESVLLPTIISRSLVYTIDRRASSYNDRFLKLSPQERLVDAEVIKLLKTGAQKPSKEEVNAFFENVVTSVMNLNYTESERREALDILKTVTPYINDQGASVKMLAEYLCIQLPLLKKK